MEHKYFTDWNKFWDFYITSVKEDLGANKFRVTPNSKKSKFLKRIDGDLEGKEFMVNVLNPLIRKEGMVPKRVGLRYDPNATTFYSTFDTRKKKYVIGYPSFTKYMCFWQPAMQAAFRHEMGHILRGDCILGLPFSRVSNANKCMDIRINAQLDRQSMLEVYKCLYFKDETVDLLVPEQQFHKCGIPYDEEQPFNVPTWDVISYYFKNAAKNQPKPPKPPQGDDDEPQESYKVGDYVVINSPASEYNDRPGKIIDIVNGEYVVEEVSDEEFDMIMGAVEAMNQMKMSTTKIIFGEFREDELLPLQQADDAGGDYSDDEESTGGGGGDEDEQETSDEEGEGEESDEMGEGGDDESEDGEDSEDGKDGKDGGDGKGTSDTEDSIAEKEKILEELKQAGVDGNPQEQEVTDDDEIKKTEPKDEKTGDGKEQEGEDKEAEEQEGESDLTTGKSEREKELEEQIREQKLKNDINRSLNNFKKIKETHGDKLTPGERASIDKTIDELENLV